MLRTVLAVMLACSLPAGAAEIARGVVFEDLDRSGVRDPGEPGVPGVAVSNGRDVVTTDAGGRWQLPVGEHDTLFITKPAGWAPLPDRDGWPRFFRHHSPGGTPAALGLRYGGLPATGPLPASVDFALVRREEPERFAAVWLADTQPQSAAELDFLRDDVVADLLDEDAAFGVVLGDLVYDDLALAPRLKRLLGATGFPWYGVPGNHELDFGAHDDTHALDTYRRLFGPPYSSFDVARVHVVVLDTVRYLGPAEEIALDNPRGKGRYDGRVDERQLEWLANDLALVPPDRLVVVAMHIPLRSLLAPDDPSVNVANRDRVLERLAGRRHLLLLAGHTHTVEHVELGERDGWHGEQPARLHVLATASGSWWSGPLDRRGIPVTVQRDGSPNGWYLMRVDGNRATLELRTASGEPSQPLAVMLDAAFHQLGPELVRDHRPGELTALRVGRDRLAGARLVVNLFDGGPRSRVEVALDGGSPSAMRRELGFDPRVVELFARHRDTVKTWVRPVPSSHLWVLELPAHLAPGVHRVEVTARDEYGAVHRVRRLLEVTADGAQ